MREFKKIIQSLLLSLPFRSTTQPLIHSSLQPIPGWNQDDRHPCHHCSRTYANKKGLDRHQKFECTYLAPMSRFRCPYCAHTSKRKDNLNAHMVKHLRFNEPRRRARRRFNRGRPRNESDEQSTLCVEDIESLFRLNESSEYLWIMYTSEEIKIALKKIWFN